MTKLCRWHIAFFRSLLLLSILATTETSQGQQPDSVPARHTTADSFDIKKASFLLPQALPAGKYSQSFYILYLVLPRDWITQIIKAPVLYYTGKYTLPYGFNLQGGLATLLVSNRINLGPFWNYSKGNYHLGLGYQVVFNYGFLNDFGFHTTLTGWEQQPSVT